MAKKAKRSRPWTKEDVQALKTMVREKTKTTVIARKLKRTETATRQKAVSLGVKLGVSQKACPHFADSNQLRLHPIITNPGSKSLLQS
jgi:hypothetical protein